MKAALQPPTKPFVRAGFVEIPRGPKSSVARAHRGAHANTSGSSLKTTRRVPESEPQRMQQSQIKKALDAWKKGYFEQAECIFEEHLMENTGDIKGWIMYAQLQKKPRLHGEEIAIRRLRPGKVASSDILVSPESVYRSRTVLHRGLEYNKASSPENRAQLIQALGLLEFTNGYEMFGSSLIEVAVSECASLRPVLNWRRVREVRSKHIAANCAQVQKMRHTVMMRFSSQYGSR